MNVFVFGDSTCFGQGVSPHRIWVTRTASALDAVAKELGVDVLVHNVSINGNTTRMALERMPFDVQAHGVDVLVAQFGLNDCNYWATDGGLPRVSPAAFAANLEEIVARGQTFGARRVLLHTNHPTLRTAAFAPSAPTTYEESARRYNEIIRDVSRRLPDIVVLNDLERTFDERTGGSRNALRELLLADGVHLSEAGHDLYLEVVQPAAEAALRVAAGTR